jgi:hypothetical protein
VSAAADSIAGTLPGGVQGMRARRGTALQDRAPAGAWLR